MRKNFLNTALILGALLLAGCGGGSSDGGNETIENKVLGVWEPLDGPCINDEDSGWSEKVVAQFTSDTIRSEEKTYSEFGCHEEDLVSHEVTTIHYRIGDRVQASNGDEAYAFDMTLINEEVLVGEESEDEEENQGQTRYSMIAMEGDILVLASGDLEHDGSSPERRANILDGRFTKIQ